MLEKVLKNLPKEAWIYQFLNKNWTIIYIWKSINLFNRVNSYFNWKSKLNFAKKKMVSEVNDIKPIIVNNEKESLILETTLIKEHKPKYNILMKDDKNYVYIKITDEEIPKIIKTRIKSKSWIYFWPFISTNYVNNVLKIIKKVFWYRSCNIEFELVNSENSKIIKNIKIKNSRSTKIPCIDFYTKRCSAPCLLKEENISIYKNSIENIKQFLNWNFKDIYEDLNKKMLNKAKELKFEEANSIKNDIASLQILEENQIVREAVNWDFDVINYLEKYDKFYISLASIRDSKIIDLKNYEIKSSLGETIDEILIEFIEREIDLDWKQTILLPKEIINKNLKVEDENNLEISKKEQINWEWKIDIKWWNEQNHPSSLYKEEIEQISPLIKGETSETSRGILENWKLITDNWQINTIPFSLSPFTFPLKIEIPKIWAKLDILKFVYKNAYEYAYRKHLDSLSTKWFTKQTMKNLLKILWYKEINKDIVFECNDISHLSWSHTVASRSVVENGKTNKNKYRKFNIKNLDELKIDDFWSMKEIITRRLKELIEKWNLPDLIIIDGWKWQLNAVLEVIENGKIFNHVKTHCKVSLQKGNSKEILENWKLNTSPFPIQIVSIAKKDEELFLPWKKEAIILGKDSQELRLIQKLRDEAHRFAITFNREKRIKSEKKNILESIPWIWAKTRAKLIKNYWNIDNLKEIPRKELSKIISKKQIEALENHGII